MDALSPAAGLLVFVGLPMLICATICGVVVWSVRRTYRAKGLRPPRDEDDVVEPILGRPPRDGAEPDAARRVGGR